MGVARDEALERHQRPDIALGRPDTNQSRSWPAQPVALVGLKNKMKERIITSFVLDYVRVEKFGEMHLNK